MKVEMITEAATPWKWRNMGNVMTDIMKHPGMAEVIVYGYREKMNLRDAEKQYYGKKENDGWNLDLDQFVQKRWGIGGYNIRSVLNVNAPNSKNSDEWPLEDFLNISVKAPMGTEKLVYIVRPISFDVAHLNYGKGIDEELAGASELQRAVAHYLWQEIGEWQFLESDKPYKIFSKELAHTAAKIASRLFAIPIQVEYVKLVKVSKEYGKWWDYAKIDDRDDLTLYYNGSMIGRSFKADPNV
jgi:hypothetical protein